MGPVLFPEETSLANDGEAAGPAASTGRAARVFAVDL
jgi:hypothetical protein